MVRRMMGTVTKKLETATGIRNGFIYTKTRNRLLLPKHAEQVFDSINGILIDERLIEFDDKRRETWRLTQERVKSGSSRTVL